MTLRQSFVGARERLAAVAELRPTAERDAALLLGWALDLPRTALYSAPARLMDERERQAYEAAVERRLRFEPVQYITGRAEFFGLELEVGPAVLIPRPETEGLVEAALERLPEDTAVRVADVGTGSGAIALAVASRLPRAEVVGLDVSAAALAVARGNAERLGLAGRVRFVASDLFAGLAADDAPFDAVLANPPYVRAGDRAGMHPEVREWEPAGALFAGEDGLEVYRRLVPAARERLRAEGLLAMEIGFGQREAIVELMAGWGGVETLADLAGIPRVVVGRRPA